MERGKSPKQEYTIDERGLDYARIANPSYRKMLVKAFAPSHSLIR